MEDSVIEFYLKKDKGDIGASDAAKVLKGIQDTIYDIGEYLFSGVYRKGGRRNPTIEKRTKLYFKKVDVGSFSASLKGEEQTALYGNTLVEESLGLAGNIFNKLNSESPDEVVETLSNKIDDPLQKSRILKDVSEFWPGADNSYELEVYTPDYEIGKLNEERRPYISELAKIDTVSKSEKTFGVLSEVRWIPERKFEIRGPDGNIDCHFPKILKDKIESFKEKPVRLIGDVQVDEAGNIKKVTDVEDIDIMETIELKRILTEDGELDLKKPTFADVDFEENEWVLTHPILNIFTTSEKYDDALNSFQEHFYYLYETYYLGDPEQMEGHALKLRDYLIDLLGDVR